MSEGGRTRGAAERAQTLEIFVIFGAAVWPGGVASPTLRRRTLAAARAARAFPRRLLVPSGAVGRWGPAEAEVMRALLLEEGFAEEEIVTDSASTDTLDTVRSCARLVRVQPEPKRVWLVSDVYHLPRCLVLFWMEGVRARACPAPWGLGQTPLWRLGYAWLREAAALPWDVFLFLRERGRMD